MTGENSNILTLKIPVALARYAMTERKQVNTYTTNRFLKNITSFIILKAASPYGVIKNYAKQLDYLAALCQCERQTIKKRLQWCADQQLITFEGSDIRLKSWKQISNLLYIDLKQYETINYNYEQDKNIHLRIFATEIKDNQAKQLYMIQKKLRENPALKQKIVTRLLHCGADRSKLNDLNYMLNAMRKLFSASFIVEPETHALMNEVRPFLNRSINRIATAWDFKSKQLVSYYKRMMQSSAIATIHKAPAIKSRCRSRNKFAHVIWDERSKQTVLIHADVIEILNSNQVAA